VVFNDKDFVPNFVKISESVGQLKGKGHADTPTHTEHGDLISLLYFMKKGK
jgi:hypothetical protein